MGSNLIVIEDKKVAGSKEFAMLITEIFQVINLDSKELEEIKTILNLNGVNYSVKPKTDYTETLKTSLMSGAYGSEFTYLVHYVSSASRIQDSEVIKTPFIIKTEEQLEYVKHLLAEKTEKAEYALSILGYLLIG